MPHIMSNYDFSSQRIFVTCDLAQGITITCDKDQTNYLVNVLRLKEGAGILVFNGRDGEWNARVSRISRRLCELRVDVNRRKQIAGPDMHYLFAPLKRARIDYMVQKATELGVSLLQPVLTHHTQNTRVNLRRLQANAIEAAEQCGIIHIPKICEPAKLDQVLENWPEERRLIYCDENAALSSPLDALSSLSHGPVGVLIGPEGGFSDLERKYLRARDYVTPISLGPRIMRADTAAVAALTLVNSVLGDWRDSQN